MPLYDYACAQCGPFRDWQPMIRSGDEVECPSCGILSKRSAAMPFLPCVSRENRIAHERNERSADSPMVMRREDMPGSHGHGHGHNHPHHHHANAHGRNMYRPTMLGHSH